MTQTSISLRAWADLFLLALLWGGSFLAIRTALDEIGFLSSVAHRTLWAALLLWAVVALKRLPLPKDARTWGAFLVMGCLNNVIPFSLMAWGQLSIESGLTSILNASTAIWGVLLAALIFPDERLTPRRMASASPSASSESPPPSAFRTSPSSTSARWHNWPSSQAPCPMPLREAGHAPDFRTRHPLSRPPEC